MKVIIQITKEEYEEYKGYAEECGWGDDVSTCIKECLTDESYIMNADIHIVENMKDIVKEIITNLE